MPEPVAAGKSLAQDQRDTRTAIRRLWLAIRRTNIENVNTVTASGSAQTLPDVDVATMHDVTLTANCTLTYPGLEAGKSFTLVLRQDATGSRTVTWPAAVKWDSGSAPLLSASPTAVDMLAFACTDGTTWLGVFAAKGLS